MTFICRPGGLLRLLLTSQDRRRLDPVHPEIGCLQEGTAYNAMGRYREAIDGLLRCEQDVPSNPWTHVQLVYAYSELGREREARTEATEVLHVTPRFSVEQVPSGSRGKNWHDPKAEHFLNDLRKAGLK